MTVSICNIKNKGGLEEPETKAKQVPYMSERERKRALRKLDDFPGSGPVEFRYRDGRQEIAYIYQLIAGIDDGVPSIQYSTGPFTEDSPDWGSKAGPEDWLPTVRFDKLAYIRDIKTNQKISLMPFSARNKKS